MKLLEVGEKAPNFEGQDQNDSKVSSSDFKGSKWVIYFYPKDNTPGCTAQACSLRDGYDDLNKHGVKVFAPRFSRVHNNNQSIHA